MSDPRPRARRRMLLFSAICIVGAMKQPFPADRFVRVRGAREHNLKNVDLDLPRDSLVVFTGISGSGKSSLAFGTLYAEAQRRYFESVAPYARRLIDQAGVPDVDSIDGLPPAVALQQHRGSASTRSTVGSVTTLSNLLRMLYSRAGVYPRGRPMLYAEDFSPNTAQGACPTCHGLGFIYDVTERAMVPDDSLSIRERAVAAWPPAWHGQNLRDILVTLGYDVDKPWRELPKKDRDWILYTDEQPTVPVYAGYTPAETRRALRRKEEPSYQGTFTGVRKYVLHTFATTQNALMKRRVQRFMSGTLCPSCRGKRLKPDALDVKFAGYDIGALSQKSLGDLKSILEPTAQGRPDPSAAPGEEKRSPQRASRRASSSGLGRSAHSAWTICPWSAARRRCPRANCSACASPRRSARTSSASSTCSTSPPQACILRTPRRLCSPHSISSKAPATRCSWWSTISR